MASTYEILLLLNARYTGQTSVGLLVRDLQNAVRLVGNLGLAFKSTTSLAQQAAIAQNNLTIANRAAAVVHQALASSTSLTGTQMLAYQRVLADQRAAQRDAAQATADLQAKMEGLGGSLAGLGTAAAVGGVVALGLAIRSAVSDANTFANALSYVQANTGTTAAGMAQLSRASLNLGASGTVPYTAAQLAQGAYVPLSAQIPATVVARTLPTLAKMGAIMGTSDLTGIGQALSAMQTTFGGGPGSASVQSMQHWADMLQKAEQFAGVAQAGQLTMAVGRLAGTSMVGGVTAPEALSFEERLTHAGVTGRLASQYTAALISSLFLKPNTVQTKAAAALGVTLGPQALARYGGLYGALEAIQQATTGVSGRPDAVALARLLGTANVVKAFGIVQAGGFGLASQQAALLASPGGTVQSAYTARQQSPVQQWADIQARFHTDLTTFGLVLTQHFEPPALHLAQALLKYVESLASQAAGLGKILSDAGKQVSAAAHSGSVQAFTSSGAARVLGGLGQQAATLFTPGGYYGALGATAHTALSLVGLGGSAAAHPATSRVVPSGFVGPLLPGEVRAPSRTVPPGFVGPLLPGEVRAPAPVSLPRTVPYDTMGPLLPGTIRAPAPLATLSPTSVSSAASDRALTAYMDAVARQATLQSFDALATTAKKQTARTGKVGPELLRPIGTDYYNRYALFSEARAQFGASAVRLAGGATDLQQQLLRKQDQQISAQREQIAALQDLIRAVVLGTTLSKQQVALESQIVGALARPAPTTSANPPRRSIGAIVR